MSGALTGSVTGNTRKVMVADVKESAVRYFETPCVVVTFKGERAEPNWFSAEYEAKVFHDIEHRSYGPGICRGCGKETWPDRPLNETKEWE